MFKVLIIVCSCSTLVLAQHRKKDSRLFHFSLSPGISSNGMHGANLANVFSFNLSAGYTGKTRFFELAAVSNANELETRGLQIAGLANVTGINAYKGLSEKEIEQKYKSGFEANLTGAQFSGVVNKVLSNVYGWQSTGGVNVVGNALFGFQAAGISNIVYKYSFGCQLAGFSNVSIQSMDGVQIATLTNYTQGGLYGVQISAFNEAGFIEGKNGYENADYTGLQLGLFNRAKIRMNGYQVGIVNVAGRMQGTQLGLINIYKRGKDMGTRDGTAIGLINVDNTMNLVAYANELFPINVEMTTGNAKNGRISSESKTKYVLNSLIYANRGDWIADRNMQWALGYALRKYFFSRSTAKGGSEFWFYAYGASILHINEIKGKLSKDVNLLIRPELLLGRKIHPKISSLYVFTSITYNGRIQKEGMHDGISSANNKHWPGFSIGLMAH